MDVNSKNSKPKNLNRQNGIEERIKLVEAMDTIARHLNDEDLTLYWLTFGVADGDIEQGNAVDYIDDETLDYIIQKFLYVMHRAYLEDSGLYMG